MNRSKCFLSALILFLILGHPDCAFSQGKTVNKDSVVYRITFRDTIVYRYDTVWIRYYVHSDTLSTAPASAPATPAAQITRGLFNRNSWGIGPMVGAYYSPYHGFDVNVGFGVQYYLFAVPSFRNPHMGSRKGRKGGR